MPDDRHLRVQHVDVALLAHRDAPHTAEQVLLVPLQYANADLRHARHVRLPDLPANRAHDERIADGVGNGFPARAGVATGAGGRGEEGGEDGDTVLRGLSHCARGAGEKYSDWTRTAAANVACGGHGRVAVGSWRRCISGPPHTKPPWSLAGR